jgi:anti-anti-sigma factor
VEQTFPLVGEIDLETAGELHRRLLAAILASDGDLVVDASALDFIDSSGLGVLVDARTVLATRGRRMQMVAVPPIARRAIEILGLLELLGVDGDRSSLPDPAG